MCRRSHEHERQCRSGALHVEHRYGFLCDLGVMLERDRTRVIRSYTEQVIRDFQQINLVLAHSNGCSRVVAAANCTADPVVEAPRCGLDHILR